ncbi:MAG: two-component system sensor histidine kinase QseC, partial [Haemophilus parainfluenzae]|nr:two-component system sensor histidine kinase QseC [Haemophilus parainfluenzae]
MRNKRLSIRLLTGLSLTALCVWFVATATAWCVVKKEAKDVFDAQLILFAERLANSDLQN